MLTSYLRLQKQLFHRQLRAWRLAPWLVYAVAPVLFVTVCLLLLERTEYAAYGIALVGLSLVGRLAGAERNDFLRLVYRKPMYRNTRLVENALLLAPFLVLLAAKGFWALALVQGGVGAALSRWVSRSSNFGAIPTPFSRHPFEFAVGLRRYWWLLPITAFLLFQAVRVSNFELGAFAYGVLILLGVQSNSEPEPGFYVWVHTLTPRAFLQRKILQSTFHLLLLLSPVACLLLLVFPAYGWPLLGLTVLGLAFLVLTITVKYTAYPERINLGHALIMAIGLLLFPTLLIIIPIYYQRALSRLHLALP